VDLTRRFHLEDQIEFLGFMRNPSYYLSFAKALLLTSRVEGFPNVILEANHFGVPVVTFNHSGLDEIIVEGLNGILVENGNLEEFSKVISNFNHSAFRKGEIKKYVQDKFNKGKILNEYIAVLSSI